MSPGRFVASALALLLMAGCAGPRPPAPDDAGNAAELFGSDGGEGDGKGGIVGVVVDEAIRPLPNVTVVLDGVANRTAAEDGSFSFVGLAAGAYLLRAEWAGYESNQTPVDIVAGEISQVRLVMVSVPLPDPYNLTLAFTGFAQVTYPGTYGGSAAFFLDLIYGVQPCERCDFQLSHGDQLRGMVIEAVMAPNSLGSNGFSVAFKHEGFFGGGSLNQPNPMRVPLVWDEPIPAADFDLTFYLQSDPLPETNKQFEVFVTLFYEQPPPEGFTAMGDG